MTTDGSGAGGDTNDGFGMNDPAPGGDAGPTVRRMSPQVRRHAREVLLAKAVDGTANGAASMAGASADADEARVGRDGFEGAPAPLNRRWIVFAAGLAVAAASAAIVVGTGVVSDDGLGLSPADTTSSQDDPHDESDSGTSLDLTRTRTTCLSAVGASFDDTSGVVYEHHTDEYTVVAVNSGTTQMCATTSRGGSYQSGRAQVSSEVSQFIRQTFAEGEVYTELLGGKVADDVKAVDIQSGGDVVASANLENGWFSAFAATTPGAELSYLVTMQDGSTKTVVVDDPTYVDPVEQQEALDAFQSRFADECFDEGYDLLTTHRDPNYLFFAADTGDAIEGCLSTGTVGTQWEATLPEAMPLRAPIESMDPTPRPTDTGPYPVMGRAAPTVTAVVVVSADGNRRDALVQDGFYTAMLPATEVEGLSYVVKTDDGETTTLGSE